MGISTATLKSQIPIRTWAQWDNPSPGFVEIDLVGHEGGDSADDFCQTLTVTDICTGWTETQAGKNTRGNETRKADNLNAY